MPKEAVTDFNRDRKKFAHQSNQILQEQERVTKSQLGARMGKRSKSKLKNEEASSPPSVLPGIAQVA